MGPALIRTPGGFSGGMQIAFTIYVTVLAPDRKKHKISPAANSLGVYVARSKARSRNTLRQLLERAGVHLSSPRRDSARAIQCAYGSETSAAAPSARREVFGCSSGRRRFPQRLFTTCRSARNSLRVVDLGVGGGWTPNVMRGRNRYRMDSPLALLFVTLVTFARADHTGCKD